MSSLSREDGIEYEVYWTKYESDESSSEAFIPGLTQNNKMKSSKLNEKRVNSTKSNSVKQRRLKSDKENSNMKEDRDKPSLKDLCAEDKTRVANLIRELAKTGREKDNATNELESERKKYHLQEQQSKEQLKLLEKERDTVKKHYVDCQQLLAQYQKELNEEQLKVAEAVEKNREKEKALKAAQEMAEQKAALAAKVDAEKEREIAEKAAQIVAEKEIADQKRSLIAENERFAMYQNGDQNRSRQNRTKSSHQNHSTVGPPKVHTKIPVEGEFYPAMTSTNRTKLVGEFYPAMTSTNRAQHNGEFYPVMISTNQLHHHLSQNIPPQSKELRNQANNLKDPNWFVNDVEDPRRSVEEFHALEAQVDDTPTLEDGFTPMLPVERQEYNDTAPEYRQSYMHLTSEQRWNELLQHRKKLRDEQEWLRRKLHEQEELLKHRHKVETHVATKPLTPAHLLSEQHSEPGWPVSPSRPTPSHRKSEPVSTQNMRNGHPDERINSGYLSRAFSSHQPGSRRLVSEPRHKAVAMDERDVIAKQNHLHTPPSKQTVIMKDKGCSPLYVEREIQTTLKQTGGESRDRVLDSNRYKTDTRYMENRSLLKDIVDTVENIGITGYDTSQDPPEVQRHLSMQKDQLSSTQRTLYMQDQPSFQPRPLSSIFQNPLSSGQQNPFAIQSQTFSNSDLLDIPGDDDTAEESQILQDIFFLK
ncbi:uncharacterized protein [Antedon mediterranea]|uniref:uncharacterized protein isoform X2 n=1 Tax=Antedon mediterranea TaxID=105859 RepID=UPI003AF85278